MRPTRTIVNGLFPISGTLPVGGISERRPPCWSLASVPVSERKVYVIDRVVTRPGRAREFVDRYLAEYAPGAADRGMTLDRVLVSPPIWFSDVSNTVTIYWELAGAQAWWEMTWKGRPDATLGQWWAAMDDLVVSRNRTMAAAADDVDALCDV